MNFQLFKERNFSENISDTILFFKQNGKLYFKNYLLINSPFLILLSIIFFFLGKFYMDFVLNLFQNPGNSANTYFETYFADNFVLFISLGILLFLLVSVFSMISFSFPAIYLDSISKYQKNEINVKIIIQAYKENAFRLFKFLIGLIFIIIPLLLIFMIVNGLLCIILIGFLLLFITIPACSSYISLVFYDYLITKNRFFSSLQNGLGYLTDNFWTHILTTIVIMVILQILQGIVTMIPYFIGIIYFYAMGTELQNNPENMTSLIAIFLGVIIVISIVFTYLCNNFLFISQGLQYFSHIEAVEGNTQTNEIDTIGKSIE